MLNNGLTVASVDNGSPLATVAVVVKAGSRYETYSQLGSAHAMKVIAGASGKNHSGFAIIRNLQQIGSNLDVSYNRETITYSTTLMNKSMDDGESNRIQSRSIWKSQVSDWG